MNTIEKYQALYAELEANRKLAESLLIQFTALFVKNAKIVVEMAENFIEDKKQQNDNIKLN